MNASKSRLAIYITALSLLVVVTAFWALGGAQLLVPTVVQPLEFNHQKHLATDITCLNCHTTANKDAFAGLPNVKRCVRCHESEDLKKPETEALKAYVDRDEDIPWKRVYRVPGHTYFSHRRHVALAKLDCAVCHGDMTKVTQSVTRQAIEITMDRCIDCHREKGVTEDCLACHR